MTVAPGPLQDVTVVDFTHMLAGPYCTMVLTDLGADVIKIERTSGDPTRRIGPFPAGERGDAPYGGYFQSINRGKRSVAVDLKAEGDRDAILELVDAADVVVENFAPAVMDRLGLGYETLRERNPALVYASIRGFGDPALGASPYADWPAFDLNVQAMGGLIGITGPEGGTPLKAGPGVGDIFPAVLGACGVLAALHHARRTGEGQHVDVAMYDGVLALCERIVNQYSYAGTVPRPQGNTHPLLSPFDVFATSDGFVTIAAPGEAQWRELCALIDRADAAEDPRYATVERRAVHGDEVRELVGAWTALHTTAAVIERLGGRIPVGPINTVEDIFADPHVQAREMLVEVEQPGSDPVRVAGSPIKLSRTPAGVRGRAPLLGEHTEEVLRP